MLVAATFRNSSSFMFRTSPNWLIGFLARLSSFRGMLPRPSTFSISLFDNHSTSRFVRCAIPDMRLIRLLWRKSSFNFRQFPRPSILWMLFSLRRRSSRCGQWWSPSMERRFCWTRERDTRLGKKDMQQICGKLYKNISMEVIVSGAETSCSSLISLYSQISCKADSM